MRSSRPEPVKIVLERRVHPGAAAAFAAWVHALVALAARDPAHEGSSVLEPDPGVFLILLRFRDASALARWQAAPETVDLLKRGEALSGATPPVVRSGLETWFPAPGLARVAAPPRWKMALVTWCALLPQVLILGALVPVRVPFAANVAITTAIPVVLLTWVIMPRLTGALAGWLYADASVAPDG